MTKNRLRNTYFFLIVFAVLALTNCAGRKVKCVDHFRRPELAQTLYRLCSANHLETKKIYLCIVQDKSFNAWIDQKPCIYVTTAFLDEIPTNKMLMCVLAHELSHYTLDHIAKKKRLSYGISAAFTVIDIFVPGAGYVDWLVNPIAVRTYGRAKELEADKNAVKYLKSAGMPQARQELIGLLKWIKNRFGEREGKWLWSTHPAIEDRIRDLVEHRKISCLTHQRNNIGGQLSVPSDMPPLLALSERSLLFAAG